MAIEVRPATVFADVAAVVGPKRPDANVCWCLSYRIGSVENQALRGTARGERVQELVRQNPPPGVLAYDGDEVVGWAAVHPRASGAPQAGHLARTARGSRRVRASRRGARDRGISGR
jgi:hypothetical protein